MKWFVKETRSTLLNTHITMIMKMIDQCEIIFEKINKYIKRKADHQQKSCRRFVYNKYKKIFDLFFCFA